MPHTERCRTGTIAQWPVCPWAGCKLCSLRCITMDRFSYIGSFSGPVIPGINTGREPQGNTPEEFDPKTAYEGAFADPRAFNKRVKLRWLGVGTAESPMFRSSISVAATALQRAGVDVVYFESPGTAHEWQTWRRDLNEFAPRLVH